MPISRSGFRVGDFAVYPRRNSIEGRAGSAHVKPKSMAVLKRLAEAGGDVVTRNELFDAVWPNSAVSDDVLTHSIVELRKAFDDSASRSDVIETVPRVGFRLVPAVVPLAQVESSRARPWVIAVVIAAIAVGLIVVAHERWTQPGDPITSLAVLPLTTLSDDPEQAWFTYGITDVLTSELAQIGGLSVTSRTSADLAGESSKTLPEIANDLGVDALVEGSVQQIEDEILLTLQLIDGRTDRHMWSRDYRRDLRDLATLRGEIARQIADEIAVVLTPQDIARMSRVQPAESEAVRLWLVGQHHLQQAGETGWLDRAMDHFTRAVAMDPGFAPAYADMALCYVLQGSWHGNKDPNVVLPLAISAAHTALELDPYLPEAHFALARIHMMNRQWEAAEREFLKGRGLNPNDPGGLVSFANFYTAIGRYEEAIEVGHEAVTIDPLSPLAYNELAFAYWSAGRLDEADTWLLRSVELDPDFPQTLHLLPHFYIDKGRPEAALSILERQRANLDTMLSQDVGYLATTYLRLGREDEARALLAHLYERIANNEPVRAFSLALIYNALGEYENALDWLEKAFDENNTSLVWIKDDPAFDELRKHPRLQDLLSRMEFPESPDDPD